MDSILSLGLIYIGFIIGILFCGWMRKYPDFERGFWDGLSMGPIWRFFKRLRK
jgi:hypothetical protein